MVSERPKIVISRPPNYDRIAAAFKLVPGVVFAYAPNIYNPGSVTIMSYIVDHEIVHIERQGDDPGGWWERYIADPAFRLEEELLAHVAEIKSYERTHTDNRNAVGYWLMICAQRISSNVYGRMISYMGALEALQRCYEAPHDHP